jgi:uncharacterized membrane protein YcaP (DUF421 family)
MENYSFANLYANEHNLSRFLNNSSESYLHYWGGKVVEYITLILRTLFLYTVILIIFRVMGKREIGELSILDLVVFIMIGEMAVTAIEYPEEPLIDTLLPISLIVMIQITLAIISLKSKSFRELVDGKSTLIISKGKIDENAMKRQRYNYDDLILQLREKDVYNMADVEFAILEPSGKLSVMKKEKPEQEGSLTLPLILDGEIQMKHLELMDKTSFWLRKELKEKGFPNVKEISFCSFHNGEFYIDLKEKS